MFDEYNHLVLQPRPGTDFFASYIGSDSKAAVRQDACFLYYVRPSDFTITTKVGGSLPIVGDAIALTIWATPELWAKLCFQKTKNTKPGEYQIVSAVTNPFSDYAHSDIIPAADCWLRISRKGQEFSMHFSKDNKRWKFVRYFIWNDCPTDLAIGIHAQSPNSLPNSLNGSFPPPGGEKGTTPRQLAGATANPASLSASNSNSPIRASTSGLSLHNSNAIIISTLGCCTGDFHDFVVVPEAIKEMKPGE